ncbi:metal ABC transporter ATP-binding protein [Dorea formicigenerans]|jgi:zinc transport system ATP-binding protein|uniref:ABC transporter ATP-binding protein n=1 Tax=Dorea formicigenerans TaxID=39486 RepID=A0A3E4Q2C1_9FIRM|nr:ABC transporter ATP-binding protein [Dorea formicigenerans]RGK86444.1 ABC transporter ATP-binding protein [Dorea formicigenerans]
MAQIICRNLAIGYDGKAIVQNMNFSVNTGEYLCVIGENGAGKSTFMKTLLGLQPPIQGEILFGDNLKQNEIGYLPQQAEVQKDFPASVREIILSGCQNQLGLRPFYNRKEKSYAEAILNKLQITDLAEQCYRELSGGQKQRVLLARALCATKKMLLLDEPVAGLDPKAAKEMYYLIQKINREENITVIMISHDIQIAVNYASHVMKIGPNIFYGTSEEYRRGGADNGV